MAVWAADEMAHLTGQTQEVEDPDFYRPDSRTVRLQAAANETAAFQLVIESGPASVRGLTVAGGELRGGDGARIEAANIRLYRMWPIRVETYPAWYLRLVEDVPRPDDFYDPLTPVDSPKSGQPFQLTPQQRLALWVDVYVPRTTPAGQYTGQIRLTTADRGDLTVNLALEVYDFVLPDTRPLAAVGAFASRTIYEEFIRRNGQPYVPPTLDRQNPQVREGLVLIRQLMQLAHDHRLDLFDRDIRPLLKRDLAGKIRLDWEDYDAIVMPYLNGSAFDDRVGVPVWPMPLSEDWPQPSRYGGGTSDEYAATVAAISAECRAHFSAASDVASRMFLWPCRGEHVSADAYDRFIRLARLARSADGQTPILTQLPATLPPETTWTVPAEFTGLADIHAPLAEWLNPLAERQTRADGHPLAGLWLAGGVPPYLPSLGMLATPADVRALPWFALKYQCTGLLLSETLNWQGDVFSTAAGAETRLFYPGQPVGIQDVLPSVRLKRLRRGLQDVACLWLLQQRKRGDVAQSLMDAMARYAGLDATGDHYLDPRLRGWVKDGKTWRMAQKLLAEEVLAAVHAEEVSNHRLLAQRLAWRQFEERTHTVRVEQVRSRVVPVTDPVTAAHRLRAEIYIDLYNEYSRDVDVLLDLGVLPDGWRAVSGQVSIRPLGAFGRRQVQLIAEGAYVPTGAAAKMDLPLNLTIDMNQRQQVTAQVPLLRTGRVASDMTIDGRLDDWPIRSGNTGGEFRLIGRRGETGKGLAERQTLVFALCDDRNLYFAFRCEEPNLPARVALASNSIHYEQLLACGEDLVELILDAGADAQAPQDLHHIVVKANGVAVMTKGIRGNPPLGKVEPWPADIKVALGEQGQTWIVELAIPLSAFGPDAAQPFWGVNFTRFATVGAEASSWAPTPRYFYDPKSLGTMFLPPRADR